MTLEYDCYRGAGVFACRCCAAAWDGRAAALPEERDLEAVSVDVRDEVRSAPHPYRSSARDTMASGALRIGERPGRDVSGRSSLHNWRSDSQGSHACDQAFAIVTGFLLGISR